ncbi:hypothetical protein M0R45_022252 [Rubus argutus]|uniref:RING-type E3 ubiquitin transferase n=1 Tax=Rubus argutus TaxID=59490 RepID=A0AAW1XFG6_RUBAR
MASEAAVSEFASFFERLRRDRDLPPIIPFIMGLAVGRSTSDPQNPDQEENAPARARARADRLVVINPVNQSVVVIESGTGGIDSLIRELAKDGQPPASKASINAMPSVKIGESGRECPICLEQFEVDGDAKEMPCKHLFHGDCVDKWLKIHGSCPVCRFTMPAEDEEESAKKNENEISVSIFVRASDDSDETPADDSDGSTPTQTATDDDGDHMQS